MTRTTPKPFCNVLAREKNLDPIGYAGTCDIFVTFELPLPWPYGLWGSAGMPPEIKKLIEVWYRDDGVPRPRLRPLAVAPEPAYSSPGFRRVMIHRRPAGPFADFAKDEYRLPEGELGPFVWALLMAPDELPVFEAYREPEVSTRDLLICTHGAVDAACAKFGFPLFRKLCAHRSEEVRVWRVTHFGGHVFAPTLLELPAGRYWAYMEGERPAQLVTRSGDVGDLYGHYRGWSGLDSSFLQAAEREVWRREGWGWLAYEKCGVTLEQGETVSEVGEPAWALVRLEFRRPDGTAGAYEARVELGAPVATRVSTASEEDYPYPQYKVTRLDEVTAAKEQV